VRKEYWVLVLANFIWASGHPLAKFILVEIEPAHLALVSTLLGLLAMGTALAATNRGSTLAGWGAEEVAFTLLAGGLMFALYPFLSFSALALIPASLNSLLVGSSPLFITLLSWLLLNERATARGVLGVGVAFLGLATVLLGASGQGIQAGFNPLGVALALSGATTVGFYTVIGRRLMKRRDALTATTLAYMAGAIILMVAVGSTIGLKPLWEASLPVKAMFTYWGVGAGFAYILYYWVLKRLPAAQAGSFIYLAPIFATALSYLLLGENLGPAFFTGMALTLIGIRLAQS
jgi:drug/metabolite transporter (DMT)-like permease